MHTCSVLKPYKILVGILLYYIIIILDTIFEYIKYTVSQDGIHIVHTLFHL